MNQLSEVQLILMWTGAFKRTKENKVKVQANRIKAHLGLVCWLISMSTPSGHRGPRYSVKHSGCVCEGLSGEINIWAKQFAFPSEWGLSNLLGSLNRTKKAEKVRPRVCSFCHSLQAGTLLFTCLRTWTWTETDTPTSPSVQACGLGLEPHYWLSWGPACQLQTLGFSASTATRAKSFWYLLQTDRQTDISYGFCFSGGPRLIIQAPWRSRSKRLHFQSRAVQGKEENDIIQISKGCCS